MVLKALVLGPGTPDQASRPGGEADTAFASAGALEPPYDPEALCQLFEHSNSLRQNVDAYATNIDGFGHRLDPAIDFDADDADRRVGECIYLERLAARDRGDLPLDAELKPTTDEVAQRRQELVRRYRNRITRVQCRPPARPPLRLPPRCAPKSSNLAEFRPQAQTYRA